MKTTPTALIRWAGAGVSAGALVTASLLLTSPAQAAFHDHTITPNLVDQTDTRINGHNDFTSTGVHVHTDGSTDTAGGVNSDKAAGYFNVDQSLAYVGEPQMTWVGTAATPGKQLVVDFDNNGTTDAILVGEAANHVDVGGATVPDWWVPLGSAAQFVKDAAPRTDGGSGSAVHGTLAEWRVKFPHAQVFAAGWSLGSGIQGDGVISSITLGDEVYQPRAGASVTTHVLNNNQVDLTSTRANGHNVFLTGGGVHVFTDGNADTAGGVNSDKAAGYFPLSGPLAAIGIPAIDQTNNAPTDPNSFTPGTQTEVDLDGDGISDGTLVGEPSYAPLFWLSKFSVDGGHTASAAVLAAAPRKPGLDGAPGYSNGAGTMSEWNHAFPNAKVLQGGWSLGSGAKGDVVLHSMTYGSNKYTFIYAPPTANVAPVAASVRAAVQAGAKVAIPLRGTDANGDTLTYSSTPAHGKGSISGHTLTFTADPNFHGASTFSYSVSDGKLTDEGTVRVNIGRATSHVALTTTPVTPTSHQRVTVHVKVTSTGNKYRGKADVYDGKTLVGTARIHTNGTRDIVLSKKLTKGTHTIRVKYRGTTYTNAKSHSIKVKVS